jgi:16S rRNA (guanine527-N7)-methyltransferase
MNGASIPNLPLFLELCETTLHWHPTEQQQQQLQALYHGILNGNRQFNLTRITDPTEFWEKHIWDSLRGVYPWPSSSQNLADPGCRIIDIGTGGGFPGLPVAIAHPNCAVTLLDATRKKIAFLQTLSQALQLSQVQTLAERAEVVGHWATHREQYTLALIRAVGSASACAEYALPFLKVGAQAVLYRGQWTAAEAEGLERAIARLGGLIARIDSFHTPLTHGIRHCIYLEKVAPTPDEFPRGVGIPAKHPL